MAAARRFILLTAVLTAAILPASAAGASHSTTIVVSLKLPAFHGTLKSKTRSCVTGRTVKLFRAKPGPDELLGTDHSNAKAEWLIPVSKKRLTSGSYYAKAPAKGSCRAAKSNVIPLA